jgi:hypothetical protein
MPVLRPFVTKADILLAYNPSKPESEAAFRRLRKEGVVSDGLVVKPRRGGRQRGTITAFAGLNEEAVIAYRHGDVGLAKELAAAAAAIERHEAAAAVAAEVSVEAAGVADLEGLYDWLADPERREGLDVLADLVQEARRKRADRLIALGAHATVAWPVAIGEDSAELQDAGGARFLMPRTPRLLELATSSDPVALRSDLMNGVLMTLIEKAYKLPGERSPMAADAFADLRPALPANLGEVLDRAPLPVAAPTGPGLRWA